MTTRSVRPRAAARAAKPGKLAKNETKVETKVDTTKVETKVETKTVAGAERRPPLPSSPPSSLALRGILDEVEAARATLDGATAALRDVDARVRAWDRSEAFLERRAHTLHDEATARFAQSLDGLHGLLVRLADQRLGPAFSPRLRAAGTRRLQAQVHRELRALQRAFAGGGALLSRTLVAFDA